VDTVTDFCVLKNAGNFRLHEWLLPSEKRLHGVRSVNFSKLMSRSRFQRRTAATTFERSDHYAMRGAGATVTIMQAMQEWPMLLEPS
jgi:hypothetical protein